MHSRRWTAIALLLTLVSALTLAERREPKTREDLEWLQEMGSARVMDWARERDQKARNYVGSYPERDEIARRIEASSEYLRYSPPVESGGRYFYTSFDPDLTRVSLHLRGSLEAPETTLIAGEELESRGVKLHRVVWPSPDGRLVAYGLLRPGSRWMTIQVWEVAGSKDLGDQLVGLAGLLSSISWAPDGSGFFYERFDLPEESDLRAAKLRGEEVRFHRIGDAQEKDRLVYETEDSENETLTLARSDDYRFLAISVRDGRESGNRLDLIDLKDPGWTAETVAESESAAYRFVGTSGTEVRVWSNDGAPRGRVLVTDVSLEERSWQILIPEGESYIDTWIGASSVGDSIIVGYLENDRRIVRVFDEEGRPRFDLEPPHLGSIWTGLVPDSAGDHAFYSLSGFVDPGTVYRVDLETGRSTVFSQPSLPFDPEEIVTRLVHFEGPAGPRIPMYLAHRRDVRVDGSRPVMVYGYGFGAWASGPWFRTHLWEYFRLGGVFALPALRGGGERGEEWHRAGTGRLRQNAVDDYIAAAEWLIDRGMARPDRLIAETQSAGASLVGAALIQRPDLFGAGILAFPLLDLMNYERYTRGARWRSELGTVEDAGDRRALLAYSPVQNVDPERCYPPMLVLPGEKDEVTPPMHAYKLVAALEEVRACDQDVLLRVAWGAGHTYGTTSGTSAASFADQISFIFQTIQKRESPSGKAAAR